MNSIPSRREIWLLAGGFAAGLVAAVALAVIGFEPLVRATGGWFDASIEAQPVAVGEQAVLFEGGTQVGRVDPGLIAIRSASREKFDSVRMFAAYVPAGILLKNGALKSERPHSAKSALSLPNWRSARRAN